MVSPFTYVRHSVESFVFQQEWAEAKKELQEEKDRVRTLTAEKEKTIETSMKQVEEMRKELSDAWRSVSLAETRAAVAEVCVFDVFCFQGLNVAGSLHAIVRTQYLV